MLRKSAYEAQVAAKKQEWLESTDFSVYTNLFTSTTESKPLVAVVEVDGEIVAKPWGNQFSGCLVKVVHNTLKNRLCFHFRGEDGKVIILHLSALTQDPNHLSRGEKFLLQLLSSSTFPNYTVLALKDKTGKVPFVKLVVDGFEEINRQLKSDTISEILEEAKAAGIKVSIKRD